MLFKTGHAVGITTASGAELLIHIGIDTVQLNGRGFTPQVKAGDVVKKGQPLVTFDRALLTSEGYDRHPLIFVGVQCRKLPGYRAFAGGCCAHRSRAARGARLDQK